ncbi:DUF4178 domain-containing protein [Sulfitobacter sp.]|uniref:DUF4178 domain-containing protein n=1 Tax=Sulfitobacter sp. TaxID=1903071 RepID=UPI003297609D
MTKLNCPNCGYALARRFATAKMMTCGSCATTLFLETDHLRNAGASGEMHDTPLLFKIGQTVRTGASSFEVMGHARFDYGTGWWDEFFAVALDGEEVWISVDEGDIIVQRPLSEQFTPDITTVPKLGTLFDVRGTRYRVTENDTATCIAVRGSFAEVLTLGSSYSYVNCQGEGGRILSGEFSTGAPGWYTGSWLDPYAFETVIEH